MLRSVPYREFPGQARLPPQAVCRIVKSPADRLFLSVCFARSASKTSTAPTRQTETVCLVSVASETDATAPPSPRPPRSVPIRLASCAFAERVGARPRGGVAPGAQARRRRPLPRPEQLPGCSRYRCLDVAPPHPTTTLYCFTVSSLTLKWSRKSKD